MKIKPAYTLLLTLVITSLLAGLAGFIIKNTVGKAAEQLQDDMAISIPFAIMHDRTILEFFAEERCV